MANDMDVKTAIETGDAGALRRLLSEDASQANALIRWGKNGYLHELDEFRRCQSPINETQTRPCLLPRMRR